MNGKPWTKEEDDFLINGSNDLNDNEISELLGRTPHSIWGHRVVLRKKGLLIGYKEKETKPMNVGYDKNNCADAAKRIGVTVSCVHRWCREGLINYTNVGDGNDKPRYLIDEDEVLYLKRLVKTNGIKRAMNFYDKDHTTKDVKSKGEIIVENKPVIPKLTTKIEEKKPEPEIERVSAIDDKIPAKKFDVDDLVYRFERIQDLNDELENLEARRNQIINERERLRNEVIENL